MRRSMILALVLAVTALLFLTACSGLPKECRSLSPADGSTCVIDLATARGDATLCSSLDEGSFRTWCYTDVASATNDTAPCKEIANARSAAFCERDVIIARGDSSACASLPDLTRNDCYNSFARSASDWQLCLNMTGGEYRDTCLDDLSRALGDPYGCVAMDVNDSARDPCLFSLSLSAENPETCGEITDGMTRAYCYLNLALWSRDDSLCDNITLVKTSETCRSLVADSLNKTTNATAPILPPNDV